MSEEKNRKQERKIEREITKETRSASEEENHQCANNSAGEIISS